MKLNFRRNKIAEQVKATRQFREKCLQDKTRPGYHFAICDDLGVPGDPNGAFFANGRYHLMYLYSRRDSGFCWGHISSKDLLHWRHHPDAIGPGEGDEGCFSGGAFVDDDGIAYLSYWKLGKGNGIGIAKSTGPDFEKWEKIPGSVIASSEFGIAAIDNSNIKSPLVACADPSNIWKKNGQYYMQTGNLLVLNKYGRKQDNSWFSQSQGDWVDLFTSTDLVKWTYLHRFYERKHDNTWTDATEDDMCPSFLPLPSKSDGEPPSGKYLQLFIAHNKGCQYYIGTYDSKKDLFIPEKHGRMSWVDNTFFAPEALIDNHGRQIMWSWLLDNPGSNRDELNRGWSGVYGLPRLLWLGENSELRMTVPPEFENLRNNKYTWNFGTIEPNKPQILTNSDSSSKRMNGTSCEIYCEIKPKVARKIGFNVRMNATREEFTAIYYDSVEKKLIFDARQSSLQKLGRPVIETAPFQLNTEEPLKIRMFIDASVIEFFVNDRQAITRRVFPTRDDSNSIEFFCEGDTLFDVKIMGWDMVPSNPY